MRHQALIAFSESSKPQPFDALIATLVARGLLDGGLRQNRAKHDGFEKDDGPVQRLERAPNTLNRSVSTARTGP
jgi:hypothetical protein